MPNIKVKLEILGKTPSGVTNKDLGSALQAAVKYFNKPISGVINCIFVSPSASQALNRQFAGNDYPTDVLSFNYFEGQSMEREPTTTLAEIAICSSIAKAQAKKYGNTYSDELVLLLVHGLLHIFGLDHSNKDERSRFEQAQSAIMKELKRKERKFEWLV
jgi:probable rRNA maturation factor